jgi:Flp pilus assembly protein TadB
LIVWAVVGLFIVFRITSLKFSNHYALRPYVVSFMSRNQWTINELLEYSGIVEKKLPYWRRFFLLFPLFAGFIAAYGVSLYHPGLISVMIAYFLGIIVTRFCIEFILKGFVEDQLINTVDTFPDFLRVFTIGLNSGLNQYNAFQFAVRAIEGGAPELLIKELVRTKDAIGYGESNEKAWQRLVIRLPFETITDFCELMIISPLHGESIMKSIEQLTATYQTKRLALVEKKATKLSQYVIPIIVMSLFPLFMIAFFGPMWLRLSGLFA